MWREITITIVALINIIGAAQACESSNDCGPSLDKICHESKCICSKDKPIEDQDRCLPQAIIGESCSVQDQCLADSMCIEGYCACGINDISVYNPSRKLNYCQPKRKLDQECNVDAQCPTSAYCSGARGCLCSNGYSAANVSSNGDLETTECLPKTCSTTSDCEEYHQCDENKCKCLATHFDISTAKCYKFGSTGGKPSDQLINNNNNQDGVGSSSGEGGDFTSILKDLTRNSDKMWLVLIVLIVLTLTLLILILSLLRRHYLGYCWTAHKKEYEPNTTSAPTGGGGAHFDKNSINNKSFRRRNNELDDDNSSSGGNQDDSTEDKSILVDKSTGGGGGGGVSSSRKGDFVAISMNNGKNKTTTHNKDKDRPLATAANKAGYQPSPLKSSTSTPV